MRRKQWQRWLRLFVFVMVAAITVPAASGVFAADLPDGIKVEFDDVDEDKLSWAMQHIRKMGLQGVIAGYDDGLFKPQNDVRQVEALIMAVRLMGLESEAEFKKDYSLTQPPFEVPDWAKGHVIVGLEKGLIEEEEDRFEWDAEASRAWVAQLLVRMLGMEDEAMQMSDEETDFSDDSSIPDWARGYVNVAVEQELIKGYASDQTFRPDRNISRVEMTVLLGRAESMLEADKDAVTTGYVQAVSAGELTVKSGDEETVTLDMDEDTYIYDQDGDMISRSSIETYDKVYVIAHDDTAFYIEVLADAEDYTRKVSGQIYRIYPQQGFLILQSDERDTGVDEFYFADGVEATASNGKPRSLNDLSSGDRVELSLDQANEIMHIVLLEASKDGEAAGVIFDLDLDDRILVLEKADGRYDSYQFGENVTVEHEAVRFASMNDLQTGDKVAVTVEAGIVTAVEVLELNQKAELSGEVIVVSPDNGVITIRDESGSLTAYTLADDAEIEIDGLSGAVLSDVKEGDKVEITVEGDQLLSLMVVSRSVEQFASGTIASIDTSSRILTLENENGELQSFTISEYVSLQLDDDDDDISDLRRGMKVKVELNDNQVIYISEDNTLLAEVVEINEDRHFIIVKDEQQTQRNFIVDDDVDVDKQGDRRIDFEDIEKGETVLLHFNADDIVTDIDVEVSIAYRVEDVEEDDEELDLVDENDDEETERIYDSVEIIVPGVDSPSLSDIKEGDIIKATYLGYELRKVEVLPTWFGEILQVNTVSDTVRIRTFAGTTETLDLSEGVDITIGNKDYSSLNALSVGDRIYANQTLSGDVEMQVMEEVRATYMTIGSGGNKLYVMEDGAYLRYDISSEVYIHDGDRFLTTEDMENGDEVRLYMLDEKVYEIERLDD